MNRRFSTKIISLLLAASMFVSQGVMSYAAEDPILDELGNTDNTTTPDDVDEIQDDTAGQDEQNNNDNNAVNSGDIDDADAANDADTSREGSDEQTPEDAQNSEDVKTTEDDQNTEDVIPEEETEEEELIIEEDEKALVGTEVEWNELSTGAKWNYDEETKVLTFDGGSSGGGVSTPDYSNASDAPWYELDYETVFIKMYISGIGNNSFAGHSALTKVDFGTYGNIGYLTEIGDYAFYGTSIKSFGRRLNGVQIGVSAFENSLLEEVDFTYAIPKKLNIGENAFKNTKLKSITISEDVESVGDGAFSDIEGVGTITLVSDYTSLGHGIFSGTDFSSFVFPVNISWVASNLFEGATCTSPSGLEIPDSVFWVNEYSFKDFKGDVIFSGGTGVVTIGTGAFENAEFTTTSLCIPDSVSCIDKDAYKNSNVTSVILPESIEILGQNAFAGCNIDNLVIGTTKLTGEDKGERGNAPFAGAHIGEVTFADGMTCISHSLFEDAFLDMGELVIPESVETISDRAFNLNPGSGISRIIIPASVESIGDNGISFKGEVSPLKCVVKSGSAAQSYVSANAAVNNLEAIVLESAIVYNLAGGNNNVKNPYTLGEDTTVTLYAPEKSGFTFDTWYTTSGNLVKGTDENEKAVWIYTVDAANKEADYDDDGNLVFNARWSEASSYPFVLNANGGVMPESYVEEAFNVSVGSIFPEEKYAEPTKEGSEFVGWFTKPVGGRKIVFGTTKLTADMIVDYGDAAGIPIYAQWTVTSGVVGSNKNIHWNVKNGILSFYVDDSEYTTKEKEEWGNYSLPDYSRGGIAPWYAFEDDIEEINFGNVRATGQHSFEGIWVKKVTFPRDFYKIDYASFKDCRYLETVHIDAVSMFASTAFVGCNIKNVTFGEDVTEVPEGMFSFATFAPGTVITIPKQIKEIGSMAFAEPGEYSNSEYVGISRGIEGIVFENGSQLETIGIGAFEYTKFTSIEFPRTLKTIKDNAFARSALKEVVFPEGMETIACGAFYECPNLTKVTIPATVTRLGDLFQNPGNENGHPLRDDSKFDSKYGDDGTWCFYNSKNPITIVAPKGSEGYIYATVRAKRYNYIVDSLASYAVFFCAGDKDSDILGVKSGLLTLGSNDLMGSTAQQVRESVDLSAVKSADKTFDENELKSDKGFLQTVKTGEEFTLSGEEFVKTGFTLTGWKNLKTGKVIKNGTYSNLTSEDEAAVLVAQWKKDKYTVKYNLNGGKYTDSKNKGIESYQSVYNEDTEEYGFEKTMLPNCGPDNSDMIYKPGYVFDGWYEDKSCEGTPVTYVGGDVFKSYVLYARWEPETYEVVFDANGGELLNDDYALNIGNPEEDYFDYYDEDRTRFARIATLRHDKTYKLKSAIVNRIGYTLDSWNTKSDGTGKKYTKNAKVKNLPETSRILYAQWKPDTYKITYTLNGGAIKNAPKTYKPDTDIVLDAPAKKGYTLNGFYWKSSKGDKSLDGYVSEDGKYVIPAASFREADEEDGPALYHNVTIGTYWAENKYKVVYHTNTDVENTERPDDEQTWFTKEYRYTEQFNVSEYLDDIESKLTGEGKDNMSIDYFTIGKDGKGTKYSPGKWYSKLSAENGDVIEVYAHWSGKKANRAAWSPVKYNVTVDYNYSGKAKAEFKDVELKFNVGSTLEAPGTPYYIDTVRKGYTFGGLYTKKNGKGTLITPSETLGAYKFEGLSTKNGAKVTLYAYWIPKTYKVTRTTVVGSEDDPCTYISTTYYTVGKTVKFPKYSYAGYRYVGLIYDGEYTEEDGLSIATNKAGYVTGIKATNTVDVELKTVLAENWYSITVNYNGAIDTTTGKKLKSQNLGIFGYAEDVGDAIAYESYNIGKKGYEFVGIASDPKGENLIVEEHRFVNHDNIYSDGYSTFGLTSKNKGKVTVYVIWEKIKVDKPVIRSAKNKNGTVTVSYSAEPWYGPEYEAQCSENILFKDASKIITKSKDVTFDLKSGKRYYVRVRQKRVDSCGNIMTGNWSKITAVNVVNE